MNTANIYAAMEIMWKGMAGIFITILLIMLCVWLLGKIGEKEVNRFFRFPY